MNDADIVREALKARGRRTGYTLAYEDPLAPSSQFVEYIAEDALAALDRLVAERDEARRDVLALRLNAEQWREQQAVLDRAVETVEEMADKIVQLEAEVAQLREAPPSTNPSKGKDESKYTPDGMRADWPR